jgi:hypothetical protein
MQVIKQCATIRPANAMSRAANLHDFTVLMLLPGIKIDTSSTDLAQ